MRWSPIALMALVALVLVGCEPDVTTAVPPTTPQPPRTLGTTTTTEGTTPTPDEETGAGGFTGQDASTYSDAKAICGNFPPAKVASDLGIKADTSTSEGIASIATAYSKGYVGNATQAAYEGCLEGLPNP